MDGPLVASIVLFASSLLAIVLMAYFALRPERAEPKCPRCDKSLPADAMRCPQCGLSVAQ